jgi:hypothetical protein
MSLAAKLAAGVDKVFEAVGDLAVTATVRRTRPGAYDPVTGAPETIVEEWRDVPALVTEFRAGEVDGERVRQTDRRILLKQVGDMPDPAPGDLVNVGHVAYTLVGEVRTTRAGTSTLLHEVQGRI